MPVLNDWTCAAELLRRLDTSFGGLEDEVSVLIVDDGSSDPIPPDFFAVACKKLRSVQALVLKKNLGHQRALAMGLCYISEEVPSDLVLIMDSDGEDEPSDALQLIEVAKSNPESAVVFAERTKRSESMVFRLCYFIYRALHYLLIGQGIRFGNFSVLPFAMVPGLTVEPMLWNHYAASVVRSRMPIKLVPTSRGRRISGESRLNFTALVIHGLSAWACYNERIGVRILILMTLPLVLGVISIFVIIGIRLLTTLAIPGWTSQLVVLVTILLLQMATLMVSFVLNTVGNRSGQPFLPARDYKWFIKDCIDLYQTPV